MKNKALLIKDLQKIKAYENHEPLIDLQKETHIRCDYRREDSSCRKVLVRKTVAEKLEQAQKCLKMVHADYELLVTEGYRHPFYQEKYFMRHLLTLAQKHPELAFDALLELAHECVAFPSVAGHPTGGAVDVTIFWRDEELDMGGEIADFSESQKLPTFSEVISENQAKNRKLLHDCMCSVGFAPFYGEWWHF